MPEHFDLDRSLACRGGADRHLMAGTLALAVPAQAEIKSLDIIAPANPGRRLGPDRARHSGGAGGRQAGLRRQGREHRRRRRDHRPRPVRLQRGRKGDAILVGGLVMVGAILTNKSPVTLDNVTPLARLTGEYELFVVPADSPIKTMADLVAKLKADPGSVSWGGGSAGGTDHILAGLIAKAAGVDPTKVNYIAHSGGGEALSLDSRRPRHRRHQRLEEFAPQVAAGKLRARHLRRRSGCRASTCRRSRSRVSTCRWSTGAACSPRRNPRQGPEGAGSGWSPRWSEPGLAGHPEKRGWLDLYQPADAFRLPQGGPRRSRRRSRMSASSSKGSATDGGGRPWPAAVRLPSFTLQSVNQEWQGRPSCDP